jgi:hypothetical protein
MVAASYTSFLIRLWRLAKGQMRVRIEQIQTGEVVQVKSLEEATAWLDIHSAKPPAPALTTTSTLLSTADEEGGEGE